MKKRFISLFAALLLGLLVVFSGCSSRNENNENKEATEGTARTEKKAETRKGPSDLPALALTMPGGTQIMANSLPGKNVLVLFQPDCEDCQREAVQIRENLQAFNDYAIYFISDASLPVQAQFAKAYDLMDTNNVHFAQTSINEILQTLGPLPVPSIFLYSEEGRLVKAFKGETEIQQILNHL